MTAAVCVRDSPPRLEQVPVTPPRHGEILLRVDCSGLCGTDLHKIARGIHAGRVLGHEIVGTVVATGDEVTDFTVGQRIVTPHHVPCGACRLCRTGAETRCGTFRQEQLEPGGFAEFVLVREPAVRGAARVVPDHLSNDAAVFLEPAACVLRGIERSGLVAANDAGLVPTAVILGGGSMGLLHVLVLRCLFPDSIVILSEPMPARRLLGTEMGATEASAPEEVAAAVDRCSDGGADAVFDTVGDPGLLEPALNLLRDGGALVLFAHFRDGAIGDVHDTLFHHEKRLVGTYSGAIDEQDRIFEMLEGGLLRPQSLVTHTMPLAEIGRAVELATTRQALKILLVPE